MCRCRARRVNSSRRSNNRTAPRSVSPPYESVSNQRTRLFLQCTPQCNAQAAQQNLVLLVPQTPSQPQQQCASQCMPQVCCTSQQRRRCSVRSSAFRMLVPRPVSQWSVFVSHHRSCCSVSSSACSSSNSKLSWCSSQRNRSSNSSACSSACPRCRTSQFWNLQCTPSCVQQQQTQQQPQQIILVQQPSTQQTACSQPCAVPCATSCASSQPQQIIVVQQPSVQQQPQQQCASACMPAVSAVHLRMGVSFSARTAASSKRVPLPVNRCAISSACSNRPPRLWLYLNPHSHNAPRRVCPR